MQGDIHVEPMTDIEFLRRNLRDIGERRTPATAVALSKVTSQFVQANRSGSGMHAFTLREELKKQFDECVKEMARFYGGFCEREGLKLEEYLGNFEDAGQKIVDAWSEFSGSKWKDESRLQLLTMLDSAVKNAARGYVGFEPVYKGPQPRWKRVIGWLFASTERMIVTVGSAVLAAAILAYLGLRK